MMTDSLDEMLGVKPSKVKVEVSILTKPIPDKKGFVAMFPALGMAVEADTEGDAIMEIMEKIKDFCSTISQKIMLVEDLAHEQMMGEDDDL